MEVARAPPRALEPHTANADVAPNMNGNSITVNNNLPMNNNNIYTFDMKHFPQRPPVNLAFDHVTYTVHVWQGVKRVKKTILHGVSGEFKAGELTAIMGPSGAGKSTLLNVIAGYRVRGSAGKVLVNGEDRQKIGMEEFKKVSCYIQQEDEHRYFLKVREAMMFASHLKLGFNIPYQEKKVKNHELLQMLGLAEHCETWCGHLSGGQRKRLSIALELITNPPVIFLDEPTTGLDSSSSTSCVTLLKSLASQGRTMVCTIHQPSALIFEQFSQLYTITKGRCLYQGVPSQLTSTLSKHGFHCPPYHNPADFVLEVSVGEHGSDITSLVEEAEKSGQETVMTAKVKLPSHQRGLNMYKHSEEAKYNQKLGSVTSLSKTWMPTAVPLWYQFFQLFFRFVLELRRNVFYVVLRLVAHLCISLTFGFLYKDNGRTADTLFGNGIYIYGSNLFLNYTALMTVLLSFPLEYKLLKREHFNRWYSLLPYCFALVLVEIPFQMLCVMVYIVPSYYLTAQPMEWFRFGLFVLFNMCITFSALGMGFLSGAVFPITISVFLAPSTSAFFSAFGFTASNLDHIPLVFHPLYYASYFRAAFQGSAFALYGYGRPKLACDRLMYCHFRDIPLAIRQLGFDTFRFNRDLGIIIFTGTFCIALCFLFVSYKLKIR